MDIAAVRDALHRQPFRAFTCRLADGRSIQVPHPDFVAVSPRQVVVISPVDESLSILEPLLIQSIEIPAVPQPGQAGQAGDEG
jgi:hypothetical protein